jgi:hypothetical protein
MKKIYYLLAFAALAFTACQKQPNVAPTTPLVKTQKEALTLTLAPADYQLLPATAYPSTSNNFNTVTDANNFIPQILAAKEPAYVANGSTAVVSYTLAAPTISVADSLYSDLTYTLVNSDYVAGGSKYGDFSLTELLNWLAIKYPTPVANQEAIITYVLYTGTDNTVTQAFLYTNGAWKQIYLISNAQYAQVGDGKYDEFTTADLPKLPGYFNFFLKNEISIADTIKAGDVTYVSYNHYVSGSKDYQDVMALTYNGSNWGVITTQGTSNFLKSNGAWAAVLPEPVITHTLTAADITLIVNSSIGTSAQRNNLNQYGDFSSWAAADLNSAMILVLTADYTSPAQNTIYNVVYLNYTGGSDIPTTLSFTWNGTAWVAQQ